MTDSAPRTSSKRRQDCVDTRLVALLRRRPRRRPVDVLVGGAKRSTTCASSARCGWRLPIRPAASRYASCAVCASSPLEVRHRARRRHLSVRSSSCTARACARGGSRGSSRGRRCSARASPRDRSRRPARRRSRGAADSAGRPRRARFAEQRDRVHGVAEDLRHLLAVEGQKAVGEDLRRQGLVPRRGGTPASTRRGSGGCPCPRGGPRRVGRPEAPERIARRAERASSSSRARRTRRTSRASGSPGTGMPQVKVVRETRGPGARPRRSSRTSLRRLAGSTKSGCSRRSASSGSWYFERRKK